MEEQLRKVLSRVFSCKEGIIDDSFSMDNVKNWTSLTHSNLIVALEQNFDIKFTTLEIIELINYKLIRQVLLEKLPQNEIL